MNRAMIAFAIAPLVVPVILFPYLQSMGMPTGVTVLALEIGGVFAYAGCIVFGIPVYLFLTKRQWVSFWVAPPLGFVAGAVAWLGFVVLFPLMLDGGVAAIGRSLRDPAMLKGMVWPGGVLRAAGAIVFWVIARPDRPSTR